MSFYFLGFVFVFYFDAWTSGASLKLGTCPLVTVQDKSASTTFICKPPHRGQGQAPRGGPTPQHAQAAARQVLRRLTLPPQPSCRKRTTSHQCPLAPASRRPWCCLCGQTLLGPEQQAASFTAAAISVRPADLARTQIQPQRLWPAPSPCASPADHRNRSGPTGQAPTPPHSSCWTQEPILSFLVLRDLPPAPSCSPPGPARRSLCPPLPAASQRQLSGLWRGPTMPGGLTRFFPSKLTSQTSPLRRQGELGKAGLLGCPAHAPPAQLSDGQQRAPP